jgi:hypothetical protein
MPKLIIKQEVQSRSFPIILGMMKLKLYEYEISGFHTTINVDCNTL